MVLIDNRKFSCQPCLKGHRSANCSHSDRELFEIKKKGRPPLKCPICKAAKKNKTPIAVCDHPGFGGAPITTLEDGTPLPPPAPPRKRVTKQKEIKKEASGDTPSHDLQHGYKLHQYSHQVDGSHPYAPKPGGEGACIRRTASTASSNFDTDDQYNGYHVGRGQQHPLAGLGWNSSSSSVPRQLEPDVTTTQDLFNHPIGNGSSIGSQIDVVNASLNQASSVLPAGFNVTGYATHSEPTWDLFTPRDSDSLSLHSSLSGDLSSASSSPDSFLSNYGPGSASSIVGVDDMDLTRLALENSANQPHTPYQSSSRASSIHSFHAPSPLSAQPPITPLNLDPTDSLSSDDTFSYLFDYNLNGDTAFSPMPNGPHSQDHSNENDNDNFPSFLDHPESMELQGFDNNTPMFTQDPLPHVDQETKRIEQWRDESNFSPNPQHERTTLSPPSSLGSYDMQRIAPLSTSFEVPQFSNTVSYNLFSKTPTQEYLDPAVYGFGSAKAATSNNPSTADLMGLLSRGYPVVSSSSIQQPDPSKPLGRTYSNASRRSSGSGKGFATLVFTGDSKNPLALDRERDKTLQLDRDRDATITDDGKSSGKGKFLSFFKRGFGS